MQHARDIMIFSCYHKPSQILNSNITYPIHVGRVYSNQLTSEEQNWMRQHTIGDDTGDNISKKNPRFNEMTGIYWVWKNYQAIGNPKYIGFEHYRRHLIFSQVDHKQTERFTVDFNSITSQYEELISRNEEIILKELNNYDCIVACHHSSHMTVWNQWKGACETEQHYMEDYEACKNIIEDIFPSYKEAWIKYFEGKNHYFANSFVMSKELFFRYCNFIFPILFELEKRVNVETRSAYERRIFISERITGVYVTKLIQEGLNIKCVPLSFIRCDGIQTDLKPYWPEKENVATICFSVDDNYLPILQVSLLALLQHTDNDRFYDIVILHRGLNSSSKKKFFSSLPQQKNVAVRFLDVTRYFDELLESTKELYIEIHVSLATYYRFLIQEIFKDFKKVLYVDSDTICLDDIAKLFDFELYENTLIAAAVDIRENLAIKMNLIVGKKQLNWADYVKNTLGIAEPNSYFQAGVILFDLEKMKNFNLKEHCLQKLKEIPEPILSDQDILNSIFYGFVSYFPANWNLEWQILFEFPNFNRLMPETLLKNFNEALSYPKLIHYSSPEKPWMNPVLENAHIWWRYASQSSWYEELLFKCISQHREQTKCISQHCVQTRWKLLHTFILRIEPVLRYLLPLGSRRRLWALKLYRWLQY